MIKRWKIIPVDLFFLALIPLGVYLSDWLVNSPLSLCAFRSNGLLCPACGGSRCAYYLLRGDFAVAFRMNPYLFCTVLYAAVLLIIGNVAVLAQNQRACALFKKMIGPIFWILWAGGLAIFTLLRNLV